MKMSAARVAGQIFIAAGGPWDSWIPQDDTRRKKSVEAFSPELKTGSSGRKARQRAEEGVVLRRLLARGPGRVALGSGPQPTT